VPLADRCPTQSLTARRRDLLGDAHGCILDHCPGVSSFLAINDVDVDGEELRRGRREQVHGRAGVAVAQRGQDKHLRYSQGVTVEEMHQASMALMRLVHYRAARRKGRDRRSGDRSSDAGMSASSFHRHFRAVAAMSPLQYQKQLRLQAARARLLAGNDDVARVGHAVGYASPAQFSRDYKRAFGAPPSQRRRQVDQG